MKTPPRLWIIACWLMVLGVAVFFRFDHLSQRPLHFDEATGARITSHRIESGSDYQFNPIHNHGPTLSVAGALSCWARGERSWREMNITTLRWVTSVAGCLLVLVPLLWRRRFGDVSVLASAALLATSPLLVYFSRMFIHEMLLALFGVLALTVLCLPGRRILKFAVVGVCVGLMFATKESFAITMLAWLGAGGWLAFEQRKRLQLATWKEWIQPLAVFSGAVVLTAGMFYTNGFRSPEGAWDAVRTFFIYQTESGHDKSASYYFQMLVVPTKGGIWWFETPVFVLAVVALARSYWTDRSKKTPTTETLTIRFLAYVALFHLLIYSGITYKTPWLMCLPWAYVCVLAGLSFRGFSEWRLPVKWVTVIGLLVVLGWQCRISTFATGRFASDTRNPYAYTPTSRDVEFVEQWMHALAQNISQDLPSNTLEPIAVVGRKYWPLPWYLREFDEIGYWPEADPAITRCPVVFAMAETVPDVAPMLEQTHTPFFRTLRADFPMMLYLRNDLWKHWMNSE